MRSFPLSMILLLLLMCGTTSLSRAQWPEPDLQLSVAYMPNLAIGANPTLLVVPDGSGPSFAGARLVNGTTVDATIRLVVHNGNGVPYSGISRESWWLEWQNHGVVACRSACCGDHPAGLFCDHWTLADGSTEWLRPPYAGGHSESLVLVNWMGTPLTSNVGLGLRVNSPDLNGDMSVDLIDIPLFASDYAAGYRFRSDLSYDGVLNLSDIPVLARYLGCSCPW